MTPQTKPRYEIGQAVIYKDSHLFVIDSYWKDYGKPGWFYSLLVPATSFSEKHSLESIPERQITAQLINHN